MRRARWRGWPQAKISPSLQPVGFGTSTLHPRDDLLDRAVGEGLEFRVRAVLDGMGNPDDVGVVTQRLRLNVGGLLEGLGGDDESRDAGEIEI